jgi:acetyl-CoA carboxylase biotin carboxyl carrier protein
MLAQLEVKAEVTGSVWKIVAQVGQRLSPGEPVMILESMKMEIPVIAEDGGTLAELRVAEGAPVAEGQVLAVVNE